MEPNEKLFLIMTVTLAICLGGWTYSDHLKDEEIRALKVKLATPTANKDLHPTSLELHPVIRKIPGTGMWEATFPEVKTPAAVPR